jgi:lysophospholipase L1-like esterase
MNKYFSGKNNSLRWVVQLLVLFTFLTSFFLYQREKPVFYIIGDSTVKNGDGTGKGNLWGWGNFIGDYFDTSRIEIRNLAIGGRSSRTFITEGRWDVIMATLKKGDYVIMQFGHNDSGPLDDTARARGTIRGIGNEQKEIFNPITRKQEVVHSYGWYIKKYVTEAKAKGAIPIVCSPIPRNDWKEGKVIRNADSYGLWAWQIANAEKAYYVDLNGLIAAKYEAMGAEAVKPFFPGDHTHTNLEGAKLNAEIVVKALKQRDIDKLKRYFKKGV